MEEPKLLKAVRDKDYKKVVKLVSNGEDVNQVGKNNVTALHLASLHGQLDSVEFLIDNGADIDAQDNWSVTPLHNAAGAGHIDVVKELCNAGAKPDVRSASRGKTPMEIARDKGKFDVIPILQQHMSDYYRKDRVKDRDEKDKREKKHSRGSGQVVLRKHSRNGSDNGSDVHLPGQVMDSDERSTKSYKSRSSRNSKYDDDPDDDESRHMSSEKDALKKQLKDLERKERMHRLNLQRNQTIDQFEVAKDKYDRDIENLLKQMERMQTSIDALADQRDNELLEIESDLHHIQDSMAELERTYTAQPSGRGSKKNYR